MDRNDGNRMVQQHNAEIESDLAVLRQIYETLPTERKTVLEQLFKKLIIGDHLLGEVLPSASLKIFMLDFDNYRPKARDDIKAHPEKWPDELIKLFARENMGIVLPHAYLAVRKWNRGLFYAPKHLALWRRNLHYPVPQDLPEDPALRVSQLVDMANEPLTLGEHLEAHTGSNGTPAA